MTNEEINIAIAESLGWRESAEMGFGKIHTGGGVMNIPTIEISRSEFNALRVLSKQDELGPDDVGKVQCRNGQWLLLSGREPKMQVIWVLDKEFKLSKPPERSVACAKLLAMGKKKRWKKGRKS